MHAVVSMLPKLRKILAFRISHSEWGVICQSMRRAFIQRSLSKVSGKENLRAVTSLR